MREASIAAPPIDFYNAPPASNNEPQPPLKNTRIIPVSASYFSGLPNSTDNFIHLQTLLRRYSALPTVSPSQAPRVSWRAVQDYRGQAGEPIRTAKYHRMLQILQRLNQIHPSVMPSAVTEAIATYKRDVDPRVVRRRPVVIDEDGKAKGIGRRKTSSAKVYIVPGDGQVLVNGKSINGAFGRIRDRESALWALKVTGRMDRYNVFALASGGGTTGQAEAITLGLAKALMVFEPALKPALRRGEFASPFPWGFPLLRSMLDDCILIWLLFSK